MKNIYYKRSIDGKLVQIWIFVEKEDHTLSEYRDLNGFANKSEWIPFDQLEEISLEEFRNLAKEHDVLNSPVVAVEPSHVL